MRAHKKTRLVIDHSVDIAADGGCDRRNVGGHRFQESVGKAFLMRWQDKNVARRQQFIDIGSLADQQDIARDVQGLGLLFEIRADAVVAADGEQLPRCG
jgi:hypothetical protein